MHSPGSCIQPFNYLPHRCSAGALYLSASFLSVLSGTYTLIRENRANYDRAVLPI